MVQSKLVSKFISCDISISRDIDMTCDGEFIQCHSEMSFFVIKLWSQVNWLRRKCKFEWLVMPTIENFLELEPCLF